MRWLRTLSLIFVVLAAPAAAFQVFETEGVVLVPSDDANRGAVTLLVSPAVPSNAVQISPELYAVLTARLTSGEQPGDLIVRGSQRWFALPVGSSHEILGVVSGSPAWVTASSISGDLLEPGTVNYVLRYDGSAPEWSPALQVAPGPTGQTTVLGSMRLPASGGPAPWGAIPLVFGDGSTSGNGSPIFIDADDFNPTGSSPQTFVINVWSPSDDTLLVIENTDPTHETAVQIGNDIYLDDQGAEARLLLGLVEMRENLSASRISLSGLPGFNVGAGLVYAPAPTASAGYTPSWLTSPINSPASEYLRPSLTGYAQTVLQLGGNSGVWAPVEGSEEDTEFLGSPYGAEILLGGGLTAHIVEGDDAPTQGWGDWRAQVFEDGLWLWREAFGTNRESLWLAVDASSQELHIAPEAYDVTIASSGSQTLNLLPQVSANGSVGTSGDLLTSRGANLSPQWSDPGAVIPAHEADTLQDVVDRGNTTSTDILPASDNAVTLGGSEAAFLRLWVNRISSTVEQIVCESSFIPAGDGEGTLGNNLVRWGDLHVENTHTEWLDVTGINVNIGTADDGSNPYTVNFGPNTLGYEIDPTAGPTVSWNNIGEMLLGNAALVSAGADADITAGDDLTATDDLFVLDDATISDALTVNGNAALGNADGDEATVTGDLAVVDTEWLDHWAWAANPMQSGTTNNGWTHNASGWMEVTASSGDYRLAFTIPDCDGSTFSRGRAVCYTSNTANTAMEYYIIRMDNTGATVNVAGGGNIEPASSTTVSEQTTDFTDHTVIADTAYVLLIRVAFTSSATARVYRAGVETTRREY